MKLRADHDNVCGALGDLPSGVTVLLRIRTCGRSRLFIFLFPLLPSAYPRVLLTDHRHLARKKILQGINLERYFQAFFKVNTLS